VRDHEEERAARGWTDLAIRLLYLLAAIALLWVAHRRHTAFVQHVQTWFEPHAGIWATFLGALALAGVSAGFSARLPSRGPYTWGRALLLGLPPFLLLAPVALFSMQVWTPPGWLYSFVGDSLVQSALGLLLGIAAVAGFPARAD
jgi:hypothetical protein